MHRSVTLVLALPLLLVLSAHGMQAQNLTPVDPEASPFPEVTAQNLLGESFALPHDLPGELRVIFVAFRQRQQPAINTWLAIAEALEADYPGLRTFEFPTISWPFKVMKPIIDNGMRGGIPSDAARARTITLFTSVSRFVEATGLPGTGSIATLLVDSDGCIRWRGTGVHTPERESALRRAIEAVRARS